MHRSQPSNILRVYKNTVGALLLCLFAVAALLEGCAFEAAEKLSSAEPESCSMNSDCGAQTCQAQLCVDPASTTLSLAIQLHYDETDGVPRQFNNIPFTPGVALDDLQGQGTVPVQVEVLRRTDSVPASIQFVLDRSISGTTFSEWGQSGTSGASLELLPGLYQVHVRPDDPALPSRTFTQRVEASEDPEAPPQAISLPLVANDEQFVLFQGQLKLRYRDDAQEVPAKHVRVTARSLDGAHSSTTYRTCGSVESPCDGTFRLLLPAQSMDETRTYQIIVRPTEENPDLPMLTLERSIEISPETFVVEESNGDTLELKEQPLFIADGIPPFVSVQGLVLAQDTGAPLEGVIVSAQSLVEASGYTTSAETMTAEDGTFTLRLPDESDVSISVAPPQETDHAVLSSDYKTSELVETGVELLLPAKAAIRGQVFGRQASDPVAEVEVVAVPRAEIANHLSLRRSSTFTNDAGEFELALDLGLYDLEFVPPSHSGLPHKTEQISAETAANEQEIVLGRTSVVFGYALTPEGELAPNARVEVFKLLDDHSTERIGEGMTNEDGRFRVIIPNPDDL